MGPAQQFFWRGTLKRYAGRPCIAKRDHDARRDVRNATATLAQASVSPRSALLARGCSGRETRVPASVSPARSRCRSTPRRRRRRSLPEPMLIVVECDGVLCDVHLDGHREAFNETFTELGMWSVPSQDEYLSLLWARGGAPVEVKWLAQSFRTRSPPSAVGATGTVLAPDMPSMPSLRERLVERLAVAVEVLVSPSHSTTISIGFGETCLSPPRGPDVGRRLGDDGGGVSRADADRGGVRRRAVRRAPRRPPRGVQRDVTELGMEWHVLEPGRKFVALRSGGDRVRE